MTEVDVNYCLEISDMCNCKIQHTKKEISHFINKNKIKVKRGFEKSPVVAGFIMRSIVNQDKDYYNCSNIIINEKVK